MVPFAGDSVAVWDPDRRRISVFTSDGTFAREVDLGGVAPPSARGAPNTSVAAGFIHLLPSTSGSLYLFAEGVFGSDEPGVSRVEMPAYRISADGEQLARFGPFPGVALFGGSGFPIPFSARTHATTVSGGLVVGTADATQFRVFTPDGSLDRIVRWPDHDRAVGGPFLSRWSDMVEGAPPRIGGLVESLPRPDRFPAYEGLLSTDAGEILVGDYPGPLGLVPMRRADHGPEAFRPERRMPARRWLVFDSDGAVVATVSTPEGFEPYGVREGLMWGLYTDEVDVESVRAYEIAT